VGVLYKLWNKIPAGVMKLDFSGNLPFKQFFCQLYGFQYMANGMKKMMMMMTVPEAHTVYAHIHSI
jgi:hypothetical protein